MKLHRIIKANKVGSSFKKKTWYEIYESVIFTERSVLLKPILRTCFRKYIK